MSEAIKAYHLRHLEKLESPWLTVQFDNGQVAGLSARNLKRISQEVQ